MTDQLTSDLLEMLTTMRTAERDVFGALPADVRERPIRSGDWSPKDHLAHLAAWKGRQADRLAAARTGAELEDWQGEDDEINARLQAERSAWSWDETVADADAVHERLAAEISAIDPDLLREGERGLVDGTYGNGIFHAQQHFSWLQAAGIGIDEQRVMTFAEDIERLVRRASLPDRDRGTAIYNTACFQSMAGRDDRARPLLREAFALRPELLEWARQDSDLTSLHAELDALATG
jgi:hypothetical protein